VGKAALIFMLFNLIFSALTPLEQLGTFTLYNWILPGRQRLPYGENSRESYNLSLNNVPAMIGSHEIVREKADNDFRVIIIGDSGAWGWFLENDDTLAGQINSGDYLTADGKNVKAYNLGYPVMSLLKDLMILEASIGFDPDLIIWPVTLESFPREKQLFSPIVQNNTARVRSLIEAFDLQLDSDDNRLADQTFLENTLVGQRRNLADLIRLQLFGFSWAVTRIDQSIPVEIALRKSDFEEDISWQDFDEPVSFSEDDLAFDVIEAGRTLTGDVPLLIINEPMFISSGDNSDLRYNSFYPRWAYDQYREMLGEMALNRNWSYLDIWDTISPLEFTDTPVHLTSEGSRLMAERISEEILRMADES
jgi:lysophospholipase L1-like esterase